MFELLDYAFMQRALAAGVLIGALCAVIGVYVVLKGLSFIGAGISHASFGGVALGFLFGVNPMLSATVFCQEITNHFVHNLKLILICFVDQDPGTTLVGPIQIS